MRSCDFFSPPTISARDMATALLRNGGTGPSREGCVLDRRLGPYVVVHTPPKQQLRVGFVVSFIARAYKASGLLQETV